MLVDTILSLGLMICFYYGLTAFAATWYFRKEATRDVKSFLLKGVAPLLGGLALAAVFVRLVIDTTDPEYGSGGSIFGLGTVFVLGVGVLAARRRVRCWSGRRGHRPSSAARCSNATRPRYPSRSSSGARIAAR